MMNLHIRHADTYDAALIAELSRQTFWETFAPHNTADDMEKFMREPFSQDALMAQVGAPGNTFLLAYATDEPAGYARLYETGAEPEAIEIARLYALQRMIGKGVGKALMQACINLAQAKRKKKVWLGVWERNDRAIRFYQAWGFEKVGGHDFVLGNDVQHDWIMEKTL